MGISNNRLRRLLVVITLLCGGCVATWIPRSWVSSLPEQPAIDSATRPVHSIERGEDGKGTMLNYYIPPLRTSNDGRVGVSLKTVGRIIDPGDDMPGSTNPDNIRRVRFYLQRPEAQQDYAAHEKGLVSSFNSYESVDLPIAYFYDPVRAKSLNGTPAYYIPEDEGIKANFHDGEKHKPSIETLQVSLCDAGALDAPSAADAAFKSYGNNPRACNVHDSGPGEYDCYDLNLIVPTREVDKYRHRGIKKNHQHYIRLWRSSITVQIKNPKQKNAVINAIYPTGHYYKLTDIYDPLQLTTGKHGKYIAAFKNEKNPASFIATLRRQFIGNHFQNAKQRLPLNLFSEPMFTSDGHVLVLRAGTRGADLPMTDKNYYLAHPLYKNWIDDAYAYMPEACDVTHLRDVKPISFAYNDKALHELDGNGDIDRHQPAKYGFAEYIIHDEYNHKIVSNVDPAKGETEFPYTNNMPLQASYPWVDRLGRNVFFSTIDQTVNGRKLDFSCQQVDAQTGACQASNIKNLGVNHELVVNYYPATVALSDNADQSRGIGMVGRWTAGKMVMLDGLLNANDFGLLAADAWPGSTTKTNASKAVHKGHVWVKLYQGTGSCPLDVAPAMEASCRRAGYVRVGSGRDTNDSFDSSYYDIPGYVFYTNFLNSTEHLFNFNHYLTPITPRDVVWHISNGHTTDEVVFDDFLDHNTFIYSNMMPSFRYDMRANSNLYEQKRVIYFDGFDRDSRGRERAPRVQNAAAHSRFPVVPAYGKLTGKARVEPVALGGINGRGVWLDGNSTITYRVPAKASSGNWFIGLFLDARFNDAERTLFQFADGSRLTLTKDKSQINFYDAHGQLDLDPATPVANGIALPVTPDAASQVQWMHIGLQVLGNRSAQKTVKVYFNGYWVKTVTLNASNSFFDPGQVGDLVIGANQNGFRGWVDEFKVVGDYENPEIICNHAMGTLIAYDTTPSPPPSQDSYDAQINFFLDKKGKPSHNHYECWHDYRADYHINVDKPPVGTFSVRNDLLLTEPLFRDVPRPDSSHNHFCLSCHGEPQGPLSVSALYPSALNATDDPRRQPMQPPPRVFGNLPPHWFDTALPASKAPPEGISIEQYVMPAKHP